ncbi:hypothetical protein [Campylobacter fetus]|uniref:hypothetical protein n=1 Tax=Campylobacter fetus TaxID=196 RepID=UPI000818A778|nr:hypothetical protein [Campylobacter fetus]OCR84620.1 hypothetical protein CFT12S05168_08935 [Campylobacter fetus subsp. testudinum]OCR95666.1 hypothetical protein CFT12S02847_07605 [Campylobacter fetus subsp. testudinum]
MLKKFRDYPTFEETISMFKKSSTKKKSIADRIIKVAEEKLKREKQLHLKNKKIKNKLSRLNRYFR